MKYQISIQESISRILSTPLGSMVMFPEYGSRLHELIDKRFDEELQIDIVRFAYESISRWEERIEVEKITSLNNGDNVMVKIQYIEKETSIIGEATYGI